MAVDSGRSGAELEKRVEDLLSRMTLAEKVRQMSGQCTWKDLAIMPFHYNHRPYPSGENQRLGIPPILFTDGPRGIAQGRSTCFPVSMARGASWDPALEERIGEVMGYEARAQGANFSGGVCVNLPRHPGWGRAQETFGEDPHLLGAMGAAMISGLQRHIMACAKHFAANSIEESRFFVDVKMDERTLHEVYLPHFKKCAQAGAAAFMSAYNKLNGHFCGHNRRLLAEILKGEWGFDGFVISDFMLGVRSATAAAAGLDIEMPFTWRFGKRLKKAVQKGRVPEAAVNEAVRRILRKKLEFEKVGDPAGYDKARVACPEHTALALKSARKGMVLLKNERGALPLDRDRVKKLAVLGRLADHPNLGDRGSSRVYPPYVVTPLAGLRKLAGPVQVDYASGKNLEAARKLAREADAVIVVCGLTWRDEGEHIPVINLGGDREELDLPSDQVELIRAAAAECGRVIVVLEAGSALTLESWKDRVPAIIMAWYPGMEGGTALAEIIFGDINPSGKLPLTFPKSTDQLPLFKKKIKTIEYGYYHGYRLFDKRGLEPAFPFGHGLSYTRYEYANLRLSAESMGEGGALEVSFELKNAGERAGEEAAQLYVAAPGKAVDRPVKELKGFARTALGPGETRKVKMTLRADELAYYDAEQKKWRLEPGEHRVLVGSSSAEKDLGLSAGFQLLA